MYFQFQKCAVFSQTVHLSSAKIWLLSSAVCDHISSTAFLSESLTNIVLQHLRAKLLSNLKFIFPVPNLISSWKFCVQQWGWAQLCCLRQNLSLNINVFHTISLTLEGKTKMCCSCNAGKRLLPGVVMLRTWVTAQVKWNSPLADNFKDVAGKFLSKEAQFLNVYWHFSHSQPYILKIFLTFWWCVIHVYLLMRIIPFPL